MNAVPIVRHPVPNGLPARAGAGLKSTHCRQILEQRPALGFFEVHAENYFCAGGPAHRHLEAVRGEYPLSIHGVGLSLGGGAAPDRAHLQQLQRLLARYEPEEFSEHLAWCNGAGGFLNDLLPLPYTPAALQRVCEHIDIVQSALGRRLLLENPATYLRFSDSCIPEPEFLATIATRTGCGLLLDVNNVYVSAVNHGYDAHDYLEGFAFDHVAEIHLAGHTRRIEAQGAAVLIDTHGTPVDTAVWSLYETVLRHTGPLPTLIEWDSDVPDWRVLYRETQRAQRRLDGEWSDATAIMG
ncbi:MAG: DUF692 domain-containing protein [Pseudomonadota bacterium]